VITLGIDLASQDKGTASCVVEWRTGEARVQTPRCPQSDEELLEAVEAADVAGIDIPLGWPDDFVKVVAGYHAGQPWPDVTPASLCYRATDVYIEQRLRALDHWRRPLSVASDRIAIPAMRAARLLTRLAERGFDVDRSGAGRLVEAYPGAALEVWGLPSRGYKGTKGAAVRAGIFAELERRTSTWLRLDAITRQSCCGSDHALDALVCALIARAEKLELCQRPPVIHAERAAREGWIALPDVGALDRLVG
jgi:predicted nuclease with RNAse H fold